MVLHVRKGTAMAYGTIIKQAARNFHFIIFSSSFREYSIDIIMFKLNSLNVKDAEQ